MGRWWNAGRGDGFLGEGGNCGRTPHAEGGDRIQTGGKSVKRSSCPGSGGGGSGIMERW